MNTDITKYKAAWDKREQEAQEHWKLQREQAMALVHDLTAILVEKYHARKVILFGSLVNETEEKFSDIDIAIEGIDTGMYFKALAELMSRSEFPVDLVPLEDARELMKDRIRQKGKILYEYAQRAHSSKIASDLQVSSCFYTDEDPSQLAEKSFSKNRLVDLVAEIDEEMSLIEKLVNATVHQMESRSEDPEARSICNESLALKLHNFYTACERIFRKIADDINGGVPESFDWHKRLLKTMTLEIPGVRPEVISKATEKKLEEYLSFRHVVRNIYGFEIREDNLFPLLAILEETWISLKQDMKVFLEFTRNLYS